MFSQTSLLLVSLLGAVYLQDVRRAVFVLDSSASALSLSNSVLQDKDIFKCTKNDKCKFIIRPGGTKVQSFSKWYKHNMALTSGAEDCSSLKFRGVTKSGIYPMIIDGKLHQIPCDMTTDGGGWTVFQRRVDGAVNFTRNWRSYKLGFGDRSGSFWLGLDLIHFMVSQWKSELRIDMTSYKGLKGHAKYGFVYIGKESESYRLTVLDYSGNATDSLKYHNGMKFSTYDRDNDKKITGSCAYKFKTGFWFKNCIATNPNGFYPSTGKRSTGIIRWQDFDTKGDAIMFIEMKFRRYGTPT